MRWTILFALRALPVKNDGFHLSWLAIQAYSNRQFLFAFKNKRYVWLKNVDKHRGVFKKEVCLMRVAIETHVSLLFIIRKGAA